MMVLNGNKIDKCVLSSVVPILQDVFEEILTELFGKSPTVVNSTIFPKLKLQIDRPDEIGTKEGHLKGVNIVPGLETAI